MLKILFALWFASFLSWHALAQIKKPNKMKKQSAETTKKVVKTNHHFKWTKQSEMNGLIKTAKKAYHHRSIASNKINLANMSDDFKNIRKQILNLKSADQMAEMIDNLDRKIHQLQPDARFLGANLLLLKPFRGIIYRLIPLASKQRITHSYLRNQVKIMASNMRIYLPIDHWEVAFKFITEPYQNEDGKVVEQFTDSSSYWAKGKSSTEKFQAYLDTTVYNNFARVANILSSFKISKPAVWDNRITFGSQSFQDDFEEARYRYITEAERYLALSSVHFGMHYLKYVVSYEIDGVFSLAKSIGKLYGIDGYAYKEVTGVPSYKWVSALKDRSKLFVKKGSTEEFESNMQDSYRHLIEGIRTLRIARETLRGKKSNRFLSINPVAINAYDENIEKQFKNIECLIKNSSTGSQLKKQNPCPVRSAVTGHTVMVDLNRFYTNPPEDLKAFLPKTWDIKNKTLTKHGKSYPNYDWGRATSWDLKAYQQIFPNLKNQKDIPKYIRTLRQAYGGEVFGAPIALFVE